MAGSATDGSVRIEQTIFVERESQRKIVLGKGGQTIKAIGQAARKEIAEIAEAPGAPLPVREGARELGRRSRALPRDGAGVPEGMSLALHEARADGRSWAAGGPGEAA